MNARIVIGGFIVAHLVSVIFYFPERILEDRKVLLNPFAGLSSFGGFLGAFLAFLYFAQATRWIAPALRRLGGAGAVGGMDLRPDRLLHGPRPPGPPRSPSFFLAVRYPDGPRTISASTSSCSRSG